MSYTFKYGVLPDYRAEVQAGPWYNVQAKYGVLVSGRVSVTLGEVICSDFPSPDDCNRVPDSCPPSMRYLIDRIIYEVNQTAMRLADTGLAINYDEWRWIETKVKEVAPQIASLSGGFPTVSRLRIEAGRYEYCLPTDFGSIYKATFGAEAVDAARVVWHHEFWQNANFCRRCCIPMPMYYLNKGQVEQHYRYGEKTRFPKSFSHFGTRFQLDSAPEDNGEVWIWHRAQTLILEDCDCNDIQFVQCQCGGVRPQGTSFHGGVSEKYLALVVKNVIGEWYTMKRPELASVYLTTSRTLAEQYRQVDPRPELTNVVTRRRYRGF